MYEINGLEYLFLAINLLIISAIIYYLYVTIVIRKPIIEGARIRMPDPIPDINIPDPPSLSEIGDKLAGPFKKVGNQFEEVGNKMRDGINSAIDTVKNKVLGPLEDIFDKVGKAFLEVPRRFFMFGSAFRHIFDGIGEEVTGLFDGIGNGFIDIAELFEYTGIFMFMYVSCGVKFIGNLHKCIFYYFVEAIGQMTYLPFRIILWLLKQFGADLYSTEKYIWDNLEWLDGNFFRLTSIHFMHFSLSVRDDCYNCRRMKQSTLSRKASDIDYDFRVGIKEKLNKGTDTLRRAGDEFKGAFM